MLNVIFELLNENDIHSLCLGHLTLVGQHESITSKPRQAMMIFISITDLLDGIHHLLIDRSVDTYNFVGADCSFQFVVSRMEENWVIKSSSGTTIAVLSSTELTNSLWTGLKNFLDKYTNRINPQEPAYQDLYDSVEEFKKAFLP
jgi:hypothetical protein